MDKLLPLDLPPGLYRQGTKYQARNRWHIGNLIRFVGRTVRPVGGWKPLLGSDGQELEALEGIPRGVISWQRAGGEYLIGIGTTSTLNLIESGELFDITPENFDVGGEDATSSGAGTGPYGAGLYGGGPYASGSGTSQITAPGVWQLDTFGDFLVAIASQDEKLYVWEGDSAEVAIPAPGAPTGKAVVTTPERFIFVLGADGDVRKVQWADQESYQDWVASDDNAAGDQILATHGELMCGRRARAQTLLWTNIDMWVASYIGQPFIYRFDLAGMNCGTVSPMAPVVVDTVAFWMGHENFFQYDGFVKPLNCEVHDYVFGDFNRTQKGKVWGMSISQFGEVWWFYPSAASTEIDRYVVYSYRENHWSAGELNRTAGADAGATAQPIMADENGVLYQHEFLEDRDGHVPFLESGPIELGDGDQTMDIQRIVPDERNLGEVEAKLFTALFPTDTEREFGPFSTTQPTFTRAKARQVRLRLQEKDGAGNTWRIGTFRLGVVPSSRR